MNIHETALSDLDPAAAWQPFEPDSKRPWTRQLAAHLHRRAGFGGTIKEIEVAEKLGPAESVEQIFDQTNDQDIESEMALAGRLVTGGSDASSLAAWWLLRMIKTPCPFLEKVTFFWHGHFATGAEKVMDARAMLRQNQLLRKHALGKFEPFVKDISSDVAMLIYLDSEENRRTRPNENYARELMELFCLGTGNYSERDIKEVARCFTGWEVRRSKFSFNEHHHDKKTKSFFGVNGNFDGNDAVEIILKQPAAAHFIASKLIRYFVFDDQPISKALAEPIAETLRETEFNIPSAIKQILASNLFFSQHSVARKIKSPVELAVGFLRFFEGSTNISQLGQRLAELGQRPLYPPNVKGWPGGRSWINASTILARANLIEGILANDKTKFQAGSLNGWANNHSSHEVGDSTEWINEFLLAIPLTGETNRSFEKICTSAKGDVAKMLVALAALPEFQLN